MDQSYSNNVKDQIAAKHLQINRMKQKLDVLNAADDKKLQVLIGRAVILRLADPEYRRIAEAVLPELRGQREANLRAALAPYQEGAGPDLRGLR